jgi:hypothetical protein
MANKRIQIEFDLNTNEVKLAGEATLSLAQQVRILQKELQKTPEGTKEFELLRKKLNDTRDNFERVNAKSRELFGTLSLIPGPVGEIAGKLNGAISLFKTFSGFSFKDLSNQFKGLVEDIKGILINLGSWGEGTKNLSTDLDGLNNSTESFNQTLSNTVSNVGAAGDSVVGYNDALQQEIDLLTEAAAETTKNIVANQEQIATLTENVNSIDDLNNATDEQINLLVDLIDENEALTENLDEQIGSIDELRTAQTAGTAATQQQVGANQALTTSSAAASTALRVLKGVIASLGIGLLIIAITTLISKAYEWVTSTEAADRANENLGNTLERLNRISKDTQAVIEEETQKNLIRAKIAGKTEDELSRIRTEGSKKQIEALKKTIKEIENEEFSANFLRLTKKQQEERSQEILKQRNELQNQINNLESKARVQELQDELDRRERLKKGAKEISDDRTKNDAEELARTKTALDAQIQLEIDAENTKLDVLEGLIEKRFALETGSASELELLFRQNQKKVQDAIDEDTTKELDKKKKKLDLLIEVEKNASQVNTENLISLLKQRAELEKETLNTTSEERLAIEARTEAEIRKIRQDAREKELTESIAANRGNFDKQIELYRQFADEVINSTNYTEAEKLRIREETFQKIEQLEQERLNNAVTKLNLSLMNSEMTYSEYYNSLGTLYDNELARYKKLYDDKIIFEDEYNKKTKELTDARNNIRQKEFEAAIATAQAIGQGFGAVASLLGENTKQGKALAIAASLINTYAAIAGQLKAFAGVPIPGYAIAQAIATGLVGFANVKKIQQTQIPNVSGGSGGVINTGGINVNARRAQGGMINGAGGQMSDNIMALLSDGEYVVNARSTRAFRPLLETINSAQNLPAFAAGGLVNQGSTPFKSQNETIADAVSTAFGQTPIKTYVTATEVSNQQQFDRIIKSRSLI